MGEHKNRICQCPPERRGETTARPGQCVVCGGKIPKDTVPEFRRSIGPDLVVDMEYAMMAYVAPQMAMYLKANGKLDTTAMREEARRTVDEMDNATLRADHKEWLDAAAKLGALGCLMTYVRTITDAEEVKAAKVAAVKGGK